MDLITCEFCKREWDGFAQCPCFSKLYSQTSIYSDTDDDNEKIFFKDASTQTKRYKWGPTKLEIAQLAVNNYMKNRLFKMDYQYTFQLY